MMHIYLTTVRVCAAVLATLLLVSAHASTTAVVRVLIMCGQSNMGGTLNGADMQPGMAHQSNVWFDNATPGGSNNSTNWTVLGASGGFGPEVGCGFVVANALTNEQLAILKDSQAGSGLTYWSTPGQAGYISLTDRIAIVRARLNAQQAAGDISRWYWGGFLWMQGEAEANATVPSPSTSYFNNMTDLVFKVRVLTGVTNLPVVLGRTHAGITVNVPQHLLTVRSNQVAAAESDPYADWVDCDDVNLQDNFHLDSLGSMFLGMRMGLSYLGLTEPNPCITIEQATGQPDPTAERTVCFTLRSSKPLDVLAGAHLELGGTAQPTTAIVWRDSAFNGTSETYTIAVSGMTNAGGVTAAMRRDCVAGGGHGNFPSVSEDNAVWFGMIPSATNLLLHDDCNLANGWLGGTRAGHGWRNQGWVATKASPGYQIDTATPLVYSNLIANAAYAQGGYAFQNAGRTFDMLGPLRAYHTEGNLYNLGRSNDEYWVSVLVRRDHNSGTSRLALCRDHGSVAYYHDRVVEIEQRGGYWTLQLKGDPACVVTTTVPAMVAQTYCMVMRMRLAGVAPSNIVDVYINPWPLGGEAPATPTATLAIITNGFNFARLVWYPGSQPHYASLDEFRCGTSYAAVTPVWPTYTAPAIITTALPPARLDQAYGTVVRAVGGAGALAWSIADGGLPNGLALGPGGVICGVPVQAGSSTFIVHATDDAAQVAAQSLTLTVLPEPGVWRWAVWCAALLRARRMPTTHPPR